MGAKTLFVVFTVGILLRTGDGSRSDALNNRITSALEFLRQEMKTGYPDEDIPILDPLQPHLKELSKTTGNDELLGQLTELVVSKLSDFTIDEVDSDLLFLRSDVSLGLPLLQITGSRFNQGSFSIEIKDVTIDIGITFGLGDYDVLEVATLELDFDCLDNEVSIQESWDTKDTLIQFLEITMKVHLERAIVTEINNVLLEGDADLYEEPVNDYFDRTFADIRKIMRENELDPMILPEDSDDFDITLFNVTMNGTVSVDHGRLYGLSTIHRAGNMSLTYVGSDREVVWGGEVGLIDLGAEYAFGLTLPIWGNDLSLSLKMSFVHLSFETGVFILQQDLALESCNITEFGPVHFEEKGAGPLDTSLYNLLANAILGELNFVILNSVEQVICNLLESVLSTQ